MIPIIKTLQTLKKAGLFSIILLCAVLAVLSVVLLVTLVSWGTAQLTTFEQVWINNTVTVTAGLLTGIAGWFMLPALIVLIGGVFQEKIIKRVEDTYYSQNVKKKDLPFWPDFVHDVKFTAQALLLNGIILPLYFLGVGFVASSLLNSYLLGKEFFETVAGHHLGKDKAQKILNKNRFVIYSNGFVITLLSLVPLLNMFMPIIALVHMIHVYYYISETSG